MLGGGGSGGGGDSSSPRPAPHHSQPAAAATTTTTRPALEAASTSDLNTLAWDWPLTAAAASSDAALGLGLGLGHGHGHGQYRRADLRRRSHHAVMAIVRVQARHERRMREADAAMAAAARGSNRHYRFSEPPSSKSLTELSRLFSTRLKAGDVNERDRGPGSHDEGTEAPAGDSKLSWLSFPMPDVRRRSTADVTGAREPLRRGGDDDDSGSRPARPRFYSVDQS